MTEQNTFQAKMAKQNNGIVIGINGTVNLSMPFIAMLCQQLIKFSGDPVIFRPYISVLRFSTTQ